MKRALLITILGLAIISGVFIANGKNEVKADNKQNLKPIDSYAKINSIDELKNEADTIVEIEGTDEFKIIDYKDIKMRASKVVVTSVIKGDKNLKELNIIQTDGIDTEQPPKKGDKLLMFLRKGKDLKGYYIPLGGTQGTFRIVDTTQEDSNSTQVQEKLVDSNDKIKGSTKNTVKTLKVYNMDNSNIIKIIPKDYNDVKSMLSR